MDVATVDIKLHNKTKSKGTKGCFSKKLYVKTGFIYNPPIGHLKNNAG